MTWQRDPERSDLARGEFHSGGGNSEPQGRKWERKPLVLIGIRLASFPAIRAKSRPAEEVI